MAMTGKELAEKAMKDKPGVIYRAHKNGLSVAAWHDGKWVMVAGKLLDSCGGGWVSVGNLYVNGKPVVDVEGYGPTPTEAKI